MKKKSAVRIKRAMQHYAFRLRREDKDLLRRAATKADQSMVNFYAAHFGKGPVRCCHRSRNCSLPVPSENERRF